MDRSNAVAAEGSKAGRRTGSDFLQLTIDDAPPGGRADWLARQLRAAIADGRLPVGSTLPASRVLAAELNVSRGVVTEAYQRLTDDGRLTGLGRRGTTVTAAPLPVPSPVTMTGSARDDRPTAARFFGDADSNAAFEALRSTNGRIDLTPGAPDLAAFPRSAWLRAERAVLGHLPNGAFGYPDPTGAPTFRRSVATWLSRTRGMSITADEVIVVAGVAQALALLARVLLADGVDRIAVEDPGSRGARMQLGTWGMSTPPVPVDDRGIRVDELRTLDVPAVLLTPAHQFPTGVVLDGTRRRELLRWATGGGLIIEDDYDAEHRYDRPPTPALQSMLPEHVCYTGSVSKLLAPALRVGWLVAPPRYRPALAAAKRESDLGNAVLPQLVLGRLFDNGDMERHLRLVRRRHRRRRDAMVGAIGQFMPNARIHGAAAGLHLTITLPGSSRSEPCDVDVAERALAEGIKVHPLSWHRQRPGPPGLVLGYAGSTAGEIADGISTLARIIG